MHDPPVCSSANMAIMAAINLLDTNEELDAVMVVAADSLIHEEVLDILYASGIIASQHNRSPEHIMCPYDVSASGLVVSEGAAAIVLQKENRSEPVQCYGGILSAVSNCDAYSIACETNSTKLRAEIIECAIAKSSLSVDDVDYINGYGSSIQCCDIHELQALQAVFQNRKVKCPISSSKSLLGHSFGSSAMLEILTIIASMRQKKLIPNINFKESSVPVESLEFATSTRTMVNDYSLKLSFGSGNRNTAVVLCSSDVL